MCGIAGTFGWPDGEQATRAMNAEIRHRGPDGAGEFHHQDDAVSVHLAHRRLSIIDLSTAANQPFIKDHLALVFNGEIYNYRELRSELEARGCSFQTSSDTEVLLEAWRIWDAAALPRLRGMFAFALFDTRTRRFVLARDHFGIKPLFYAQRGKGIAFCSELKGLLHALKGVEQPQIDPSALVASMMYYWVPENHCAIRGVQKLPAGSWLELNPGAAPRLQYFFQAQRDLGPDDGSISIEELRHIVETSVKAHLVADVPVSAFLSGGLDSSIITALAKRSNPAIDAYTIRFRPEDQKLEAMPDDPKYARLMAAREGVKLHEIEIAPDVVQMLPRMVHSLDEPIGDAYGIDLSCRSRSRRESTVIGHGSGRDFWWLP
jgi:asparagine synthase (glutamine-hydrolysing)